MGKYTAFSFREPVPGCQSDLVLRGLSLFSSWGSWREVMLRTVLTFDDENTGSRSLLCAQFRMSAIAAGRTQDLLRDPGE